MPYKTLPSSKCSVCGNTFNSSTKTKSKKFCSKKCKDKQWHQDNPRKRTLSLRLNITKDKCSLCGFVPLNPCQMDVDHINGNPKDNSPQNLQVLCANCHRLKTLLNNDGAYKFAKEIRRV